jgi:hypothetical protein
MGTLKVSRNADRYGYGHAVGILLLDHSAPAIPGDVLNARSFTYPVVYKYVDGLTVDRVFAGDPDCAPLVIAAARELEGMGVGGISTNCGYLLRYQEAVARAVAVPVFLSSLLQLPLIARSTVGTRPIGLVVANAAALGNDLLERSGVPAETPLVIADLAERPEFRRCFLDQCGELDSERMEREAVAAARELIEREPGIGAIVLECAVLPAYAAAVQRATGRPTFDFMTLIDFFHAAQNRKAGSDLPPVSAPASGRACVSPRRHE